MDNHSISGQAISGLFTLTGQLRRSLKQRSDTSFVRSFKKGFRELYFVAVKQLVSLRPRFLLQRATPVSTTGQQFVNSRGKDRQISPTFLMKFMALAEGAPVGIALWQKGRFAYVNSKAAELCGYDPEEVSGQMDLQDIVRPRAREQAFEQLQNCQEQDRMEVCLEVPAAKKDGQHFLLEVRGWQVLLEGHPVVVCYFQDISGRRNLEQKLTQAKKAEQRRIGQNLHDGVASRLTGISMLLESCIQDRKEGETVAFEQLEEVQKELKDSLRQVRRLSHGLVNSVGFKASKLPVELRELVKDVNVGFEGNCRFEGTGEIAKISMQKASTIYRIAQEALTNAAKHSQANQVWVTLEQEKETLILTVEDDGVGFKQEELAEGIGLDSMKQRACQAGTELQVKSTPGMGTVVCCQVPLENKS